MIKVKQTLSTGELSINIYPGKWKINDLFHFAQRQNPKRSFLFVSKILGKHIPVSPAKMRQSYVDLSTQLPVTLPEPILFIGMAETAVGLACGVFEEASKTYPDSVLLTTTRHCVEGELLCEFKEDHSHATDHLIYWPGSEDLISRVKQAKTLVLIDDEATTGNTFKNLIHSLDNAGLSDFDQIVTMTLTDWSGDCFSFAPPVHQISLMKGDWHWDADKNAPLPIMPNVNITAKGASQISARQDWGRLGLSKYVPQDWLERFNAKKKERILVLGTGEFLYPPFLLAERLEKQGGEVLFSSTTRSPIAEGLAIESRLSFRDHYGLNIPNFCYNVAHLRFDRIILCIETQVSDVDDAFIQALMSLTAHLDVAMYD